ncbi:MAG: isoleucine--tRNA ligase, partial [Culicoidibacterales bacterium]
MEYKDTLLMPDTAFEMRGNLPKKEPLFQQKWEEKNYYRKTLKSRKESGKPQFLLYDGPPYANGSLHMGHAINKVLKDFVLRSKTMAGFEVPYVPGWDTHGLPIEQALTNKGIKRKEMPLTEYRELCLAYAKEQIATQRGQFERLGIWGDFSNFYATYQPTYEAEQIRVFNAMLQRGLVYKGLKPVYWSPTSESALAEAEIEYQDKVSPSIYVGFPVADGQGVLDSDVSLVIWTTTPWTMPANRGIAVSSEYDYAIIQFGSQKLLIAEQLVSQFNQETGNETGDVISIVNGSKLAGITAKHPIFDKTVPVILGDHVTLEAGTGLVHTAPGHGEDDFIVGKANNLEVVSVLNAKGVMTEDAGPFEGMYYEKANGFIIEYLQEKGILIYASELTHSYPHDWRTKKPIVFRATPQWFVSIDPIRSQLLDEIHNVDWVIPWGSVRLGNMIESRGDWCISRQRAWGVPIPIIYCEDGTPITDESVIEHIAQLFGEHGSNVWFERDVNELLPQGYSNEKSPNGIFEKEMDIMDVWFDSGSAHSNYSKALGWNYPADMYLEGSDQYRGWFNSSLITGVSVYNQAPYKSVLSHGFVLDGQGRKMSKSIGNVIDPLKMIDQYGADVVRLWVATVDYQSDVRISDDIMKQVAESYRKIRNTFRFVLGNINPDDFTLEECVPYEELESVDKYMLARLKEVSDVCISAYSKYEFSEVYKQTLQFFTGDLSSFYLDFTKDILYCEAKGSLRRRQVQTVLYEVFHQFVRILAPILPHTMDEAWSTMSKTSIFEEEFKTLELNDTGVLGAWKNFFEVRDSVLKALEVSRADKIIGKSLEANVRITMPEDLTLGEITVCELKTLLIVSKVEIVSGTNLQVEVTRTDGIQCERCWNHYDETEMHD